MLVEEPEGIQAQGPCRALTSWELKSFLGMGTSTTALSANLG